MTTESGAPVKPGDVLAGKYAVERVLGSGGMGVVVAARHVHLGERAAIKFLLPHALKKPEVVRRFEQEARAAARIKSEHVARVFDVGKLDDGAPYMIMEFLEGQDLSSTLKERGALPIEAAVEYVLQACEAVAEAHSLGIIHRDLKPANLFVTRRADGSPVVKVIDFGISKVVDPSAGGDVELTKTDVMMGSPVYMAPEQMISARDVDVRADVWSLGIILFYAVMGEQPFKGQSVTQLFAATQEGPPSMRASRPDVPASLEAAILRCLRFAPKERWGNVAELALALGEHAPPHAQVSVERVARTLGVTPVPASAGPAAPARSSAAVVAGGVSATESTARGSAEGTTGPQTDGSWGGTQGPAPRRSRGAVAAMAAAAAIAAAIGALVVVRFVVPGGSGASPETAPAITGTGATAGSAAMTAVVVPASSEGEPVKVPAVTAAASNGAAGNGAAGNGAAAPSSSASASAAALTGTATAKAATSAKPAVTARPVTTKPKGDLFSDPH